jgi:hypothetical protein
MNELRRCVTLALTHPTRSAIALLRFADTIKSMHYEQERKNASLNNEYSMILDVLVQSISLVRCTGMVSLGNRSLTCSTLG